MEEKRIILDNFVAVLYAIAAVSGALGGCAVGCYYLTHDAHPRWAFAVAYAVLGVVFGVLTFAGLSAYHYVPGSIHQLILWSIGGGIAGAIALASANMTVKIMFRKLGIEVQLTMSKKAKIEET